MRGSGRRFAVLGTVVVVAAGLLVTSVASATRNPLVVPPTGEGQNARGGAFLDCTNWRYPAPDPSTLPPEYDGGYKLTSERDQDLAGSAQHLCGQKGGAVDLAWGLTHGRDDVTIAVLDSGIEWNNVDAMKDLAAKAYLNRGELSPPRGGTGTDEWDANGDGVFNVDDYANDERVTDRNANGLLDPEDLISDPQFSDGRDDDNNGYVDDISGWDFLHDDNNPQDDPQYGHGTGEAKDSTAAANDFGEVGTCPTCRFLPVRVSDSFLAPSGQFAAGVLFALDSGADVIQEALGALNNVPQAQAAIDAAYNRGVPIVASMADEASKHPNLPGSLEHTMAVNSVTTSTDVLQPKSYLALNGCTNYGGRTFVTVASSSCSSEATGLSAGVVGLALSYARERNLARYPGLPDGPAANVLSANELYQLVSASADDVDFATPVGSDPANNTFLRTWIDGIRRSARYPTTPAWDGTFGYGRLNAYELLKAIRDNRIPPEADITSPKWFDLLGTRGKVAVTGRVAAMRANSFGYRLEWTTGMQPPPYPEKDTWHVAAEKHGLRGAFDGTLGSIDLARVAAALPDGGKGTPTKADARPDEERFSVRVRVVVTDDRGLTGESQKQVFVHDDPDLVGGAKRLAGVGGASPAFADLDGDGQPELVVATDDGYVHAYKPNGREAKGWPVRGIDVPFWHEDSATAQADGIPTPAGGMIYGAPAIADLDRDGRPEVVMTDISGNVLAWNSNGKRRRGFGDVVAEGARRSRVRTNAAFSELEPTNEFNRAKRGFASAPALADLDGDGRLEIVAAALDRHLYAWRDDGRAVKGFPVLLVDPAKVESVDPVTQMVTFRPDSKVGTGGELTATPAVGDLDGDGRPEIVVGAQEQYDEPLNLFLPIGVPGKSANTRVYAVRATGTATPQANDAFPAHPAEQAYLPGWPAAIAMSLADVFPTIGDGVATQAAIADVHGDARPEVVVGSAAGPVYVLGVNGKSPYFFGVPIALSWMSPASFRWPRTTQDFPVLGAFGGPAVGQLQPGGKPEVAAPTIGLGRALDVLLPEFQYGDAQITAWNSQDASGIPGFPHTTSDLAFFVTPAIADVDGDGSNDVLATNGVYLLEGVGTKGNAKGWPKLTGGWSVGTPALGDWDGDGRAELAIVRRDGVLLVWHTKAPASSLTEWTRFGHDGTNAGFVPRR